MADRDPLAGRLIAVTGGNGFLGKYVVQDLLRRGARVRLAARNPEQANELKPLANLGQLQFARFDIANERSRAAVVAGVDGVVNLVGSFDGDLMTSMGTAPGHLAEAARDARATRFVHVSAIGADPTSEARYAQAKALGEERVRDAFPQATVVRPSILFGEDDNFLNMFAGLIRLFPILPVFGPDAGLQLTYVDDAARGIIAALADPRAHGGKIYELGGPEVLDMMEINRRIAAAQNRKRTFIPVPDAASGAFASLPGTPMSSDQWTLLKQGNRVSGGHPGFRELGITPRPLGLFLDDWMTRYRKQGRFSNKRQGLT